MADLREAQIEREEEAGAEKHIGEPKGAAEQPIELKQEIVENVHGGRGLPEMLQAACRRGNANFGPAPSGQRGRGD